MGNILSKTHVKQIHLWINMLKGTKQGGKVTGFFRSRKFPYKILARGVNRIVFDLRNGNVLKVAITVKGIGDNRNEARLYKISTPSLKRHLGRVISNGNGWLIMRKYNNRIPRTFINKKRMLYLLKTFADRKIMPNDVFVLTRPEPTWRNLGISKKGRITILDYGNFKKKKISVNYRRSLTRLINKVKNGVIVG